MPVPLLRAARRAALAALLLAAALPSTLPAQAAPARERMLVSGEWLARHLRDPGLVLLHVGERAEYDREHIPGARFVTLGDVSTPHPQGDDGLHLQMLPAAELRERLAALGVSDGSRVVLYYGGDWVSPTTRVFFALDHAGLGAQTSVLDGGMQAWKREGRPVTAEVPRSAAGRLAARPARDLVVDAEWVRTHRGRPGVVLVDGRAAAFYDGVQAGGGRSGHIPGARSIPFTEITDERLAVRSPAELDALFRRAGAKPGDTVVGYCHIGQQATAVLFAARTLGYDVRLYDGSFEDWDRRADLPVENPAAARRGGQP
ncbi:MAG: rhodanese-like domain-containing protein [Longimicrobiaceae bacterium]